MNPAIATDSAVVDRRYDFLFLFDVQDGNPNGDPDAGNMPRIDPQTMHGIVTDVCIKRKLRNYVEFAVEGELGGNPTEDIRTPRRRYEIYVKHRGILANEQKRAFKAIDAQPSDSPNVEARSWMCKNFFDVRAFGAVMTTGKPTDDETARAEKKKLWNCGQVRGPIQITFARSISPITPLEARIARVALTNPGDTGKISEAEGADDEKARSGQFGDKKYVPYGLYLGHGFVSPPFAKDTGFTYADLDLLWEALVHMFDHDRSAARGLMATRRVFVFQHDSSLGNAAAHDLFALIEKDIHLNPDVQAPRAFTDYSVPEVGRVRDQMPSGVHVRELITEGLQSCPWK